MRGERRGKTLTVGMVFEVTNEGKWHCLSPRFQDCLHSASLHVSLELSAQLNRPLLRCPCFLVSKCFDSTSHTSCYGAGGAAPTNADPTKAYDKLYLLLFVVGIWLIEVRPNGWNRSIDTILLDRLVRIRPNRPTGADPWIFYRMP